MGYLLFSVAMGAALAVQSAINGRLRRVVGSAYLSSGTSFLVAWLFLLLLSGVTHQTIGIAPQIIGQQPWWLWTGGLLGAVAVSANVVLFPKIGSLQTTVLPILGQILMSLFIDQFGWFFSPLARLTWVKAGGVLLVLGGVGVALGQTPNRLLTHHSRQLGAQAFAVVTGMLMAIQTAVNGHLGTVLHTPLHATLVSFTVGLLTLILVNLGLRTPLSQLRRVWPMTWHNWWLGGGGILGALYVLTSSWLVPRLGTGQVVVLALFGQILFSALIENFGWLSAPQARVTHRKIWGLVLMFCGVLLVKFAH